MILKFVERIDSCLANGFKSQPLPGAMNSASGIVSMLEVVESDFGRSLAEAESIETSRVEEHDSMSKQNKLTEVQKAADQKVQDENQFRFGPSCYGPCSRQRNGQRRVGCCAYLPRIFGQTMLWWWHVIWRKESTKRGRDQRIERSLGSFGWGRRVVARPASWRIGQATSAVKPESPWHDMTWPLPKGKKRARQKANAVERCCEGILCRSASQCCYHKYVTNANEVSVNSKSWLWWLARCWRTFWHHFNFFMFRWASGQMLCPSCGTCMWHCYAATLYVGELQSEPAKSHPTGRVRRSCCRWCLLTQSFIISADDIGDIKVRVTMMTDLGFPFLILVLLQSKTGKKKNMMRTGLWICKVDMISLVLSDARVESQADSVTWSQHDFQQLGLWRNNQLQEIAIRNT